jgi:hypothetical protein
MLTGPACEAVNVRDTELDTGRLLEKVSVPAAAAGGDGLYDTGVTVTRTAKVTLFLRVPASNRSTQCDPAVDVTVSCVRSDGATRTVFDRMQIVGSFSSVVP